MAKTTRAGKASKKKTRSTPRSISQNQKTVKSIKAKADEKRSFIDILADRTTALLGSNLFLFVNLLIFITWIMINTGHIPGIKPFDKFPFSLLTTSVSLEAIILAILVLISQNRASKVADLREEVQLQVNVLTEEEITRMMWMLVLLLQKNDIPIPEDKRLQQMLRDTDVEKIEKSMEKQIEKS
jgi:uncharacterized membrane protein